MSIYPLLGITITSLTRTRILVTAPSNGNLAPHHGVIDRLWSLVLNDRDYNLEGRAFVPVAIGTWDDARDPRNTHGDVTIRHAVFAHLEYTGSGRPELFSKTPPPEMAEEPLDEENAAAERQDVAVPALGLRTAEVHCKRRERGDPNDWDVYDSECNSPKRRS